MCVVDLGRAGGISVQRVRSRVDCLADLRHLRVASHLQRFCFTIVTWLILPVVICLSQRLSHACLSISDLYGETANGSLNQL